MGFGDSLGGLFGAGTSILGYLTAGKGGMGQMEERVSLWRKLQSPDFDVRSLTPQEYHVFAREFPQEYEAMVPEEQKLAMDSPEMRQAQMEGLSRLREYATQGTTPEERGVSQEAMQGVMGAQSRMTEAALQSLAQRGRLGGGTEIQARLAANQAAGNLAHRLGTSLMAQQADQRFAAAGALPGMAAQGRAQDIGLSQFNANVINRANELAADAINRAGMFNAYQRGGTQAANVERTQRTGEQNVQQKNLYGVMNRNYKNEMGQQNFQNEISRLMGLSGTLGDLANLKELRRAQYLGFMNNLGQGVGKGIGGGVDAILGSGGGGGKGGGGAGLLGLLV